MANSRLEKIGTIYTRSKGLLTSGALNWNDRPLWYDVYEAFPPKEEPRFDRPVPAIPVKQIFYTEDKIRARLQQQFKSVGTVNLVNSATKTFTQRIIETYKKLEQQYGTDANEDKIFTESLELLQKERDLKKDDIGEEPTKLSAIFQKEQKLMNSININVKDIFKE